MTDKVVASSKPMTDPPNRVRGTMLDVMHEKRIFTVQRRPDNRTFEFTDACVQYFHVILTPVQIMQLSNELRLMIDKP